MMKLLQAFTRNSSMLMCFSTCIVTTVFITVQLSKPGSVPPQNQQRQYFNDSNDCALNLMGSFIYKPASGSSVGQGAALRVTNVGWWMAGMFSNIKYRNLSETTAPNFTFVTAMSSNHYGEGKDGIATIQTHFPNHTIILYDLGLTETQIKQIKSMCSVTYRKFQFEFFPDHVRNLHSYAWKPIIMATTLSQFGAIVWLDSSARLKSSNFSQLYKSAVRNGGFVFMKWAGCSIWTTTHAGMYTYLPAPEIQLRIQMQYESGSMLIYNTEIINTFVIKPLLACALVEKCIAPVYKLSCQFRGLFGEYANCHRYDQSAVNILVGNLFQFKASKYTSDTQAILDIWRESVGKFNLKKC